MSDMNDTNRQKKSSQSSTKKEDTKKKAGFAVPSAKEPREPPPPQDSKAEKPRVPVNQAREPWLRNRKEREDGLPVPSNEARKAKKYKKIHVDYPLRFASTEETKEPEPSVDDLVTFGSSESHKMADDEPALVLAAQALELGVPEELDPNWKSAKREEAAYSHSHAGEPELWEPFPQWEQVVVMRSKDEAETNDVEGGRKQEKEEGLPPCPSDSTTPSSPVSHPQASPGAYRLGPDGVSERVSSEADIEQQMSPSLHRSTEAIPVIEAKLVIEPENDSPCQRKRIILFLLAIVLVVVVVGVVVGVVVMRPDPPCCTPPHNGTDKVVALLGNSLTNETMSAIQTTSTPQNKAFQWLVSLELNISSSSVMERSQKFALATLFYATNGVSWNRSDGWLHPSLRECYWFGCNCTEEGLIHSVELVRNGLNGMLPEELSLLSTELTVLNLWENVLMGSIPSDLAKLSKLSYLDLSVTTMLRGTIPAALGSLTKLEALFLDENELTGMIPSELGKLSKLTFLYLNKNKLIGSIPADLGKLTILERLYLFDNALTGSIPADLGRLSKLAELVLYQNTLSGPIPADLGDLTNLQLLYLWDNKLTGSIPWELSKLSSMLTHIELAYNKLSGTLPSELGNWMNLEHLAISSNSLTGPIPTELGKLSMLTSLWLHTNQLNQNIPTEFGALANIQVLHLYDNRLSGTIPSELGALSFLRELSVYGNQLSGEMPDEICDMRTGLNVTVNCDRVQCAMWCDCTCV